MEAIKGPTLYTEVTTRRILSEYPQMKRYSHLRKRKRNERITIGSEIRV